MKRRRGGEGRGDGAPRPREGGTVLGKGGGGGGRKKGEEKKLRCGRRKRDDVDDEPGREDETKARK